MGGEPLAEPGQLPAGNQPNQGAVLPAQRGEVGTAAVDQQQPDPEFPDQGAVMGGEPVACDLIDQRRMKGHILLGHRGGIPAPDGVIEPGGGGGECLGRLAMAALEGIGGGQLQDPAGQEDRANVGLRERHDARPPVERMPNQPLVGQLVKGLPEGVAGNAERTGDRDFPKRRAGTQFAIQDLETKPVGRLAGRGGANQRGI